MCVCVCVCMYVYIHTYIYIYMHISTPRLRARADPWRTWEERETRPGRWAECGATVREPNLQCENTFYTRDETRALSRMRSDCERTHSTVREHILYERRDQGVEQNTERLWENTFYSERTHSIRETRLGRWADCRKHSETSANRQMYCITACKENFSEWEPAAHILKR